MKKQLGLVLLVSVAVGAVAYVYQNFSADLFKSDASEIGGTPNLLAQKFPNSYGAVQAMSEQLSPTVVQKIAGQFEGQLKKLSETEEADGGDITRTLNKGSTASAWGWKKVDSCLNKTAHLYFNKATTSSSSGTAIYIRGNLYLYQYNSCTGVSTWSYGTFPVNVSGARAQYTPNGTTSARFVLNEAPVGVISSTGGSSSIKLTADCTVTGQGFTSQTNYLDRKSYEYWEYKLQDDTASRGGGVTCTNNSLTVGSDVYPSSQMSGYLHTYNWLRQYITRYPSPTPTKTPTPTPTPTPTKTPTPIPTKTIIEPTLTGTPESM